MSNFHSGPKSLVTMGYPWLTIVHVAHDVASMPELVLKGGGVVLIYGCLVVLFSFLVAC